MDVSSKSFQPKWETGLVQSPVPKARLGIHTILEPSAGINEHEAQKKTGTDMTCTHREPVLSVQTRGALAQTPPAHPRPSAAAQRRQHAAARTHHR